MVTASFDLLGGVRPFEDLPLDHGTLADLSLDALPTRITAWHAGALALSAAGTHFGFVVNGQADLVTSVGRFPLAPGMYFSLPGEGVVRGSGRGVVATSLGCRGVFSVGGPVEERGRLRFIDGCTSSMLLAPVAKGDPWLNAVYFPPAVDQTPHTHPSMRAAVVARGSGALRVGDREVSLDTGQAFLLRAGAVHSFRTYAEPMLLVAYHPDSGGGPTHDEHPAIASTIVDGVPASRIEAIRTRPDGER